MCSDNVEVAVVYQRSCYQPSDFSTEADWQTRLMIERSTAVLCPNIAYHLAGTKKVQQVLARPGVVEKFIDDADAVKRIRLVFAEQLSLDMVAAFFFLAHLLCFSRNFALVCFFPATFVMDVPVILTDSRVLSLTPCHCDSWQSIAGNLVTVLVCKHACLLVILLVWSSIAGSGAAEGRQRRVSKGRHWPQWLTRAMNLKQNKNKNITRKWF